MFKLIDPLYYFALTEVCRNLFTTSLLRYTLCRPYLRTVDVVPILERVIARRKDVPERLKPDFAVEIKRLEREMKKFCNFVCSYVNDPFRFADHLAWNWEGEIDARKTLVSAIGSENFRLDEKFKMACLICDDDSLSLVTNSEGFYLSKDDDLESVYDFYFYKKNVLRDTEELYQRAVICSNPFGVEYFWPLCSDFPVDEPIPRCEKIARFLISKCSVHRRHWLVPLAIPFYRKRNRFHSFESDFWDVLHPVVKERTLSHLCREVSVVYFGCYLNFSDCVEEEILFFAKLLTGQRQMSFLREMWRFHYFDWKFRIEFVVRLLRACEKENARRWIDEFQDKINPPVLFELLSKNPV